MPSWMDGEDGQDNERGDSELLLAVIHTGRKAAGDMTHDLNSALQCLGDALFGIREDALRLHDDGATRDRGVVSDLAESLRLANEAYDRLCDVSRALPHTLPKIGPTEASVHLRHELVNLVALTSHDWRNRVEVVVNVDASVMPFQCEWWVVRTALLKMLGTEIHAARAAASPGATPRVTIAGAQRGDRVELRMWTEANPAGASSGAVSRWQGDSLVELCATQLRGEIAEARSDTGARQLILRFPVMPADRPQGSYSA